MKRRKEDYPTLKAHDSERPVSFIYFEEDVELPNGQEVRISLHFDRGNSFEEIQELVATLKAKRLKFVVEEV